MVLFTSSCGNRTHKKKKSGQCYNISNVAIKEFNDANYLTLTKYSTVDGANNLNIERQDDVQKKTRQLKVQFPPDGIDYVQSYLSCNKCHSKIIDGDKKNHQVFRVWPNATEDQTSPIQSFWHDAM